MDTGRPKLERWFIALSAVPAIAASALASEACVFRLVRGRWPIPNLDDPKQQSFLPFHGLVQLLAFAIPAVVVLEAFVVIRQWRFVASNRRYAACVLLFALGIAACRFLPSAWLEWFAD